MDNYNGYTLSRAWFNFCFENPEIVKPNHIAIYFFAIEHCNRLGWKPKFGFPTTMVMEATGIKSYNTYIKCLNQIIEWGFIILIEKSKNQFSSNIIALSKNDKAHTKALDKALIKHSTKQMVKQRESTVQSNDSINKQETNKQETKEPKNQEPLKNFTKKDFRKILLDIGVDETHVNDWFKVRDKKKAAYTGTALKRIIKECSENNFQVSEAVRLCAEYSWSGFKFSWVQNVETNNGNRNNNNRATDTTDFNEVLKGIDAMYGNE